MVHRDTPVAEAPAFVSDRDLFFAPGRYGADDPETLRLLDAALRSVLAGVLGPVGTAPPAAAVPEDSEAGRQAPEAVDPVAPTVEAPPPLPAPGGEAASPAPDGSPPETGAAPAGAPAPDAAAVEDEAPAEPAPPVEVVMPPAPTEPTPAAAARGGAVAAGAGGAARAARDLPTAAESAADARGAVTEPVAETAARAREDLAGELGERPAPSPEIVQLVERIRTAIANNRPEDQDELLESDPTQEARSAGGAVTSSVEGQVEEVSGSYDAMSTPPAGSPALSPTPVTTPGRSSAGMGVDAASAAPDPVPSESTSLDVDVAATDQRIADSGMETRVTAEIPDGPFQAARDARGELGELAQRTPEEIRAEEQAAIDTAQADMARLQQEAVAALRDSRGRTVDQVGGGQGAMTGQEELTRDSVSQRAQTIYADAERRVTALLTPLSRTAMGRWEAGLARSSREFHDSLDRVQRWIEERHSGVVGSIVAIGDYVAGLPRWVTDEYNRAERQFGNDIGELLLDISSDVNGVVAAAQAIVRQARTDIGALFDQMEAEFPEWAAQERARFDGMLDGLAERTTEAQTGFVRDVSRAAITAVNEAHAAVEAKRQEAGGLIGRVVAAIEEFIDDPVRAIINGLLRLVHIPPDAFWALLAQIQQVVADIAADPENFLNNLVAAVKLGFQQFFDHFGTHLLTAFWQWLFSGLETPIPLPAGVDPLSLFTFALQLMGITWPRIREILVRHIGPTAVEVLEAAWQLISVLVERGPGGLVDLIKEQLTPETIVGMILDAAIEYLVETLIVQVATYLFSLLNPAGAVAQAIRLIYQVCAWIFRNAARIFAFVQAVVGGIANVIAGNISGMAQTVERALASMMVVAIDFLAGLLGLGGLPGEVAQVIVRLQTYVLGIVERVVVFLVTRARALLARMGIGGSDEAGADRNEDDELGTTVRFSAEGESHRLFFEVVGTDATLMLASSPAAIQHKIREWRAKHDSEPDHADHALRAAKLGQLEAAVTAMDQDADRLAVEFRDANRDPRDDREPPDDSSLEGRQRSLASVLREAFELFEDVDPQRYLDSIRAALPGQTATYAETIARQWQRGIEAPKLVPDGTTAIWDLSVVSSAGAVAYAGRGPTHQQLLPYFLVGSQRGEGRSAATAAFANYALETDSPDPSHTVRTDVLRVLGSDTVVRMQREAARKIRPEDNSALLEQIRGMGFTSGVGRWGAFDGIPGDSVSPLIRAAIDRAGGVVTFLRRMVSPGACEGVTWSQFLATWNASPATKNHVKGLFRRVEPDNHEWIPTGYVPRVVEAAVDAASSGDIRTGMRWVTAQNTLRSRTHHVLHPPQITTRVVPGESGDTEEHDVVISGHVGAFRTDDGGTRVTTGTLGTEEFHDWLRQTFDATNSSGPLQFIQSLQQQLPVRVWDGGTAMFPAAVLSRQVGMLYRCDDGVDRNLTIAELALRQQANWMQIQNDFSAAYAATEADQG